MKGNRKRKFNRETYGASASSRGKEENNIKRDKGLKFGRAISSNEGRDLQPFLSADEGEGCGTHGISHSMRGKVKGMHHFNFGRRESC